MRNLMARSNNKFKDIAVTPTMVIDGVKGIEPEDERDYLMGLGLEKGGFSSLIRSTYKLQGLKTYFTTGKKEIKECTLKDGMTAPQAAGVLHNDFEEEFIRAQTISCQNLINSGSIANAKIKTSLRSKGKEYIVNVKRCNGVFI